MASPNQSAAIFDPLRPRLVRVAYRMLGSVADAEDVVQEAFLRWFDVDRDAVREPEAFLRRIVTRLCLDHLKSARHQRETYTGPWLPDPLVQPAETEIDEVTLPLMIALERLSPLNAPPFSCTTCSASASRKSPKPLAANPPHAVSLPPEHAPTSARHALASTCRRSAPCKLHRVLRCDARRRYGTVTLAPRSRRNRVCRWRRQGAGRVINPIAGIERVIRLHTGLARVFAGKMSQLARYGLINGLPGFITVEADEILQTTALQIEDEKITAIYITRNPDKLRHLTPILH